MEEFDGPGGVAEFVASSGEPVAVRCLRLTDVLGNPLRCGVSFQAGHVTAEYAGHGVEGISSIWIDSADRISFSKRDGLRLENATLATRPVPERPAAPFVPRSEAEREAEHATPVVAFGDVREGLLNAGSFVLGSSVPLVAGSLSAGRINDQRVLLMGGQALGGAALSVLPSMWLDGSSPWRGWGPGMGGAIKMTTFSAGALTAPLLGAVGTWGTGELLQGSRNPAAAFGGVLAGAAVGTLLSLGVNYLLRELPREFQPATLGLTIGFIGSGATIGYELLGGGPRPR
ncbi:hypothetical protein NR798_46900 [Archangium gephyra]|uniref:hypothetical protein n=1 Tax=Archangium gephyra TaxID=48 RepID=UPI0035D528AF